MGDIFMTTHCFYFLKDKFPEYEKEAKKVEIATEQRNPETALITAGNLIEILTKYLAEVNNLGYLKSFKHSARLKELYHENIIPFKQSINFENARKLRNKVAHQSPHVTIDDAYRMHRLLYLILTWFYKDYGDSEFKPEEYNGPIYKPSINQNTKFIEENKKSLDELSSKISNIEKNQNSLVDEKSFIQLRSDFEKLLNENKSLEKEITNLKDLKRQIEDIKESLYLNEKKEEGDDFESSSDILIFEEGNQNEMDDTSIVVNDDDELEEGSYLLRQLSKLSTKSKESVEGHYNLDSFKDYLHVDRTIKKVFMERLKDIPRDSGHLVMLCGNVGDGKSHLLAYLNSKESDLANQFYIWGDGSISLDPDKNAIDTLMEVLEPFNDNNFNNPTKKIILAINLGTLNDFIESERAKKHFKKLRKHIYNSNIFDSKSLSENYFKGNLSIINFSDYNIFELTENSQYEVQSCYLSSLIDKIVLKDVNKNPFYKAYRKDKDNGYKHPILYNYKMLGLEEVKRVIIDLIVKISIKYKKFISTRAFLNFIHEIIVPPEINVYDDSWDISEYFDELLPNLLFSKYDSGFMKYLYLEDPTRLRIKALDQLIIDLNTSENIIDVVEENIDVSSIEFFRDSLKYYGSLKGSSTKEMTLLNTLIRFAYIFPKGNLINVFNDEDYTDYLKYLYFYHKEDYENYEKLFYEVKNAVFRWQGTIDDSNIIVNSLNNFYICKELDLTPTINEKDYLVDKNNEILRRFKTDILITFNVNGISNVPLYVDFSLYKYIIELNKGFRPNKNEEKVLIAFKEFIKDIINTISSNNHTIIKKIDSSETFDLSYNKMFNKYMFGGVK